MSTPDGKPLYSILPIRVCDLHTKLNKTQLVAFISMCNYTNRQGLVFATAESIGNRCGLKRHQVADAFTKFKQLGLIRDLEKKWQLKQISKWKTGRRQVLYLDGLDEIPRGEELPAVAFSHMDEDHREQYQAQADSEVKLEQEPVDMQYLSVLNTAVSSALGQPVQYSHQEYEKYMRGNDIKVTFEQVFPKARAFIQQYKRVPKLHEIMGEL